jgi:hypothetical protein
MGTCSPPELMNGYVHGRRWRRDLYNEFRGKFGARPA